MKRIFLILLGLTLLLAFWYLFIKEYGYTVKFESKYGPGSIYYDFMDVGSSEENQVENVELYAEILQTLKIGDTLFRLNWNFDPKTDSTTQVTVHVRNEEDEFGARLDILNTFSSTYGDRLKSYFKDYYKSQQVKQQDHGVRLLGTTTFEGTFCVCAAGKSKISEKASEMVHLLYVTQEFFDKNDIKPTGNPLISLNNWDEENQIIDFDFCFPIAETRGLKSTPLTKTVRIPSFKAWNAEFRGNYRFSHRGWIDLRLKVMREQGTVSDSLIEVYYNNPMIENEPTEWKSEIYIPMN